MKTKRKYTKPGWIEEFEKGYRHFWRQRGIEAPSGPDLHKMFLNQNKMTKNNIEKTKNNR